MKNGYTLIELLAELNSPTVVGETVVTTKWKSNKIIRTDGFYKYNSVAIIYKNEIRQALKKAEFVKNENVGPRGGAQPRLHDSQYRAFTEIETGKRNLYINRDHYKLDNSVKLDKNANICYNIVSP